MAKGRNAKIVMETCDSTVKAIMKNFEQSRTHSGLFIGRTQAREMVNDKTLVIICDTHRKNMTAYPELIDLASTIVLIDHHRRSEDFILNTDLLYHEPFASSSCEMVAEMLQYMGRCGTDAEIAEAMYAGMVVDTNNFVFKTGARTFEAAAYLKRLGADPMRVKRVFRESMKSYTERAQIVSDAVMYRESIAISKVYSNSVLQETIAKAANDLLEIEGVSASFVIAKLQGAGISISGRSLGDVNIQMITEKLGGGGHMLQGAAQLESVYVDEAEDRLKAAIDEYLGNR
jgi:c-di-AMP phosphodiesterase-like protein